MSSTLNQLVNAFKIAKLVINAYDVNSFAEEAEKIKLNYSNYEWRNKMEIVQRNIDSSNAEARQIVSSLSR